MTPDGQAVTDGYTGLRPESNAELYQQPTSNAEIYQQPTPTDDTINNGQKYELISYKSKKKPHNHQINNHQINNPQINAAAAKAKTDNEGSFPMYRNPLNPRKQSLLDKDAPNADENHYEDVRRGSLPYVDMEGTNNNGGGSNNVQTSDVYESMYEPMEGVHDGNAYVDIIS